ncbi:hypothetical protein [Zavarzinia sp. CC-PAN008]|uniref:hypothetical protein n=1 Tax=Zavarzinia sp. CC-PAN008 TaxID=3243332 RepID=UPI003F744214
MTCFALAQRARRFVLVLLVLPLALAGCWPTKTRVLGQADGVAVTGIADGLYTGTAEGQAENLVMRITWNAAAKAYVAETQDDPEAVPMALRVKPLAGDFYLMQAEPQADVDQESVAVLLVRVQGGSVALMAAEAPETKRIAAATQVTVGEFGDLTGSATQIEAFLAALAADPAAKVAATFTRTGD